MRTTELIVVMCLVSMAMTQVVELTDATLPNYLKENPLTLVMFYAPWCGHCKSFKSTYKKLEKTLVAQGSPIKIAMINAEKESQSGALFKITAYPMFKFIMNDNIEKFDRATIPKMIEQLTFLQISPYTTLSSWEEFEKMKSGADSTQMWTVVKGKKDHKMNKYVKEISKTKRKSPMKFVLVENDEEPELRVFKNFDEKEVTYSGPLENTPIKVWVEMNSKAQVREISRENTSGMNVFRIPVMVMIVEEGKEEKDAAREMLESLKEDLKNKIMMVYVQDKKISKEITKESGEFFPVIIRYADKTTVHTYVLDGPITKENILEKANMYLRGELKEFFKSQKAVREEDQTAVRVVTKNSFKDEVIEKSKTGVDVLVMFYAVWCGQCKNIKPVYQELANQSKEFNPKVVFANYDNEKNADITQIQYYPTFMLFQNGKPKEIKNFSRKKFLSFYEQHGSFQWSELPLEKERRIKKKALEETKKALQEAREVKINQIEEPTKQDL